MKSETPKIMKENSYAHVSGESVFTDDRPLLPNEVFVDFVASSVAYGNIKGVDTSKLQQFPSVIAFYTAKDLQQNLFGGVICDQPLLADKQVTFIGQPVVIIAAKDRNVLREAKQAVKLEIEELPAVISIEEAMKSNSLYASPATIERGDVVAAFEKAEHVSSGVFTCNGQEHYYFEAQAAIAYPVDGECLEIHASTQNPSEVQHDVASMLGIAQSQVVCVVKRIGGGFGGKETQNAPFAQMAALVAYKTKRPARIVLSRDNDILCTGKRHPFTNHYKIGFTSEGQILAYEVDLNANGGAYADLSTAVLARAMLHSENTYSIENVRITGRVFRTNLAPNTAFRAFGAPQGVATIEQAIEEIACFLKKDPLEIRLRNLYGTPPRHITPYGQTFSNNVLPGIINHLLERANYQERRVEIANFNKSSSTHLRGLSLMPIKFGISFTNATLNQGSALVNVHQDGSIQVSTGAVEMGQGVNTRIAEAVADVFSIPVACVKLMSTSTEKIHNTSPTAASASADLNGNAAILAAKRIRERLAHCAVAMLSGATGESDLLHQERAIQNITFAEGFVFDCSSSHFQNKISFSDLLHYAWKSRVGLGEQAYYKTPGLWFDREKGIGNPFQYYTQGAAVSEVQIDRFTGQIDFLSTDIVMDVGESQNAQLDKGQIAGAFIQGLGWCTLEELVYSHKGRLLSCTTGTYKIPGIREFPQHFTIELFGNPHQSSGLKNSKGIGEPPFVLGLSVWIAIKNALANVSPEGARTLKLPATGEEIMRVLNLN
ncbi:MAG: molybdopterin-dependent oxidoreductase [Oligoflexia bacterium]|nr:molybdopterin-dependent oxidoreductase [Oligoflexia bacterium]